MDGRSRPSGTSQTSRWESRVSFQNARKGEYVAAAVDAVGVVVDTAAAVVPGVPGGAGTGIRAIRAADKAADTAGDAIAAVIKSGAAGKVSRTGGETAATIRGRAAHTNYQNLMADGVDVVKEYRLKRGRAHIVGWKRREVRELKLDNPRARRRGLRKLEEYRRELEAMDPEGGKWTGWLDTY